MTSCIKGLRGSKNVITVISPQLSAFFYISLSSFFKEIFSTWFSRKAHTTSGHKPQGRELLALLGFQKVIPDIE